MLQRVNDYRDLTSRTEELAQTGFAKRRRVGRMFAVLEPWHSAKIPWPDFKGSRRVREHGWMVDGWRGEPGVVCGGHDLAAQRDGAKPFWESMSGGWIWGDFLPARPLTSAQCLVLAGRVSEL